MDCDGSTAYSMERDRPYDGQPHTDAGERGKTEVRGLTFRDVADCFVMGFIDATQCDRQNAGVPERERWIHNDIYNGELVPMDKVDPLAAMKCMLIRMEKMMGIYPNVPKLNVGGEKEETDGREAEGQG